MPRLLTIIVALCLFVPSQALAAKPKPARRGMKRPLAKVEETREVWATDDAGRYRVSFPLHNRVYVEAGSHFVVDDVPVDGGSYGAAWDFAFDVDFPDEEIWWQLRHTAARVRWEPQRPAGWDLRVSLLEADYLRHDTSSYVLIPAQRDIRLPAPFDVVVGWKLGGGRFALDVPDPAVVAWDIGEFQVMADFVRDPRYRHRFAIGAAARYRLTPGPSLQHDLVPLSGAALLYAWENARGTFEIRFDGAADYGALLVVGAEPLWTWRTSAALRLEWTPIAINDLPVSVFVDGNWKRAFVQSPHDEWTIRGGLRLSLPIGL